MATTVYRLSALSIIDLRHDSFPERPVQTTAGELAVSHPADHELRGAIGRLLSGQSRQEHAASLGATLRMVGPISLAGAASARRALLEAIR